MIAPRPLGRGAFTNHQRLEQQKGNTMAINLNDRFVVTQNMPYSGPQGGGIHHRDLLVEVTSLNGGVAHWSLVEVINESGAPQTDARSIPTTGGFVADIDTETMALIGLSKI